jgi:cell division protein FtsQ
LAKRGTRLPAVIAAAREPVQPPRAEHRTGLWHRPQVLDLVSDVLLLFAAVGLGWAAVTWALSRPLFPLRELVLNTTPAQVTQAQLEYVARTAIHGNFFTTSLEDARIAFEKLPWVRHAEVRRLWPDSLELSLEEHKAIAYWKNIGEGNDVRLISAEGEVFAASSDINMPVLSGPQGAAATVLERFTTYAKILQPLQARLIEIELSARGAWQLRLDNDLVIVLGREQERSPLNERLARFAAAWPQLRDGGVRFARADLRYPGGFALTPMNNKATPQTAAGIDRQ